MGDRANFGFTNNTNKPTIYLYGHWAGEGMMNRLAKAIDVARPRWTDAEYATRIAVSHIIGDTWTQETGWGLSVDYLCDNEHSIPIVDWEAQTVTLYSSEYIDGHVLGKSKFTMDLDSFVKKFKKA
jgi:hypothetical protein